MGCANTKTAPKEDVDYQNVQEINPDYPAAYIPDSTKSEKYDDRIKSDIQERIDAMPKGTDGSYKSLLTYLSNGATKEIHHVTAIYLWMKGQDYQSESLDTVKDGDTPRGYMKMIKHGTGDLKSFFTIMCRRSGFPCNIIAGLGKDEQFFIGAPEKSMQSKWNAVFADGEWHLAHIEWAINSRHRNGQREMNSEVSDYFFLTDPDEFITFCCPDDFNWQLLDQPVSKKIFLNWPYFQPEFYVMNGRVLAPKSGTAKASNGKLDIEIEFPKRFMENIELGSHVCSTDESHGMDKGNPGEKDLDKYIFVNRKNSKFIFEGVFPTAGKYLFDIYGAYGSGEQTKKKKKTRQGLERLCQFRIISDKDFEDGQLEALPDSPVNGWGPGPHCRSLGLIPLTHIEGCLYIKPGEVRDIWFRMEGDLDVTTQLVHSVLPVYELVEQVECTKNDDEVGVRVQIPELGQYALKIYCREAGTKEFNEACVYLLRQRESSRLPEKYRDKMFRNRLEYNLKNHTTEQALVDALEVFKCYNVPDHGETKEGQQKLKQYWEVKRELRSAIKGRNKNNVHKWVTKAKQSKYHADLQEEIMEAERLEGNLTRMKGHIHPMARMDPITMIEVRNYKHPPVIVHDVMTSTYLLLGERKDDLEDWEQIQYLMGKHGKEGLQKRVVERRPEDIHIEIAEEADSIIHPYSIDKCRGVSNGICSFYKWNKQMIKDVRRKDEEEREKIEAERRQWEAEHSLDNEDTSKDGPVIIEPVVYKGRWKGTEVKDGQKKANTKEEEEEEGEKEEEEKHEEQEKKHPFAMSPSRPSEGKQLSPVSYAGWKPSV